MKSYIARYSAASLCGWGHRPSCLVLSAGNLFEIVVKAWHAMVVLKCADTAERRLTRLNGSIGMFSTHVHLIYRLYCYRLEQLRLLIESYLNVVYRVFSLSFLWHEGFALLPEVWAHALTHGFQPIGNPAEQLVHARQICDGYAWKHTDIWEFSNWKQRLELDRTNVTLIITEGASVQSEIWAVPNHPCVRFVTSAQGMLKLTEEKF